MARTATIATFGKRPAQAQAIVRVREWTRERFSLPNDATVMVAEVSCRLPGCPPVETAVVFWTAPDRRHQFKLFKPVAEVACEDLPPAWFRDALIADDFDCGCC